jgi:hypothetical protein
MAKQTLMFDPKSGGDVEANLDFAADGLVVFDRSGRTLQRWPYGEIIHAFAPGDRRDDVLAQASRPEIQMQVRNDAVYEAIRARAPQLRRLRRGWRTFFFIVEGMPHDAQVGVYLFGALVLFGIYGYIAGWLE